MTQNLLKTPLYNLHVDLGAKMVPFAGYDMPVQYPLGVKKEHLHCRDKAGLFDVSHMGQIKLHGNNVAQFIESLVPVDIIDLPEGKQRYAFFTNDNGGIIDDLMVSNYGDYFYLVINAACVDKDLAHIRNHLPNDVKLEVIKDRALIALQGPHAAKVLSSLIPETSDMIFMDTQIIHYKGIELFVSRSGYTGEDGFEISIPETFADSFVRELLAKDEVEMIGLGARDSLRLECGLCLYGNDLNEHYTPIESSLIWAISKIRRNGESREGGFPGATHILNQLSTKNFEIKRVGLISTTRAPVREGTKLFNAKDEEIGFVSSGTFGPTIEKPISMAFIDKTFSEIGTEVFADVRGKKVKMIVSKMPFVPQSYYRG